MKNIKSIIACLILGMILFLLCFDYNKMKYPNELYNVYLDGNYLGTIDSKDDLEKYIDEKASHLINAQEITTTYCENDKTLEQIIIDENLEDAKEIKYYDKDDKKCMDVTIVDGEQIEKIYTPNGLNIEKVLTYNGEVNSVEDIYSKIVDMKSFTVQGYQFTAREEDKEKYFYVIDKDIFEEAVKQLINTYVGEDEYNAYLDGIQLKIETVGSTIENVYIKEDITVKQIQIPLDEKIYTESNDLAQYLLYGDDPVTKTYKVKMWLSDKAIPKVSYTYFYLNAEIVAEVENAKMKYNISGTVTDSNGTALNGAVVSIQNGSLTSTTNASGAYTLNGIYPGTYNLDITYNNNTYKGNLTVIEGDTKSLVSYGTTFNTTSDIFSVANTYKTTINKLITINNIDSYSTEVTFASGTTYNLAPTYKLTGAADANISNLKIALNTTDNIYTLTLN